ncbi:MAG: ATPase [Clostridiales bacterium]|nr:ATPase [Clostridiales bacterium]
MIEPAATAIREGRTALGIELGSTRIKAVLIDEAHHPIASGSFAWENQLKNGYWTYDLSEAERGLQASYRALKEDVLSKYGESLASVGAIGISGMMHGYLPFDAAGKQLAAFRTWRNTNAERAAKALSEKLNFNIPIRWSVSHLYQAMLDTEAHVTDVGFLTTLAGYVHWRLTGERVLGVGEASGMFPIDSETNDYDETMLSAFDRLAKPYGFGWTLRDILPKVLVAGQPAGRLTREGAILLDPSGSLKDGIPMAPPEGDAGTGMIATDSVAVRTGNVSAGTSIFAMLVLERPLSRMYPEIDMVTTPAGRPVAMAHCNNCTSDWDAWVRVLKETAALFGANPATPELYDKLYQKSLEGAADCAGVLTYNYLSGEPVTGLSEGRPMVVRRPEAQFTLANFLRASLYSTLASLRVGMEILYREGAKLDRLMGHGGLFKTEYVGQKYMADAMGIPVSVMATAGEGGPHGMAILAAYRIWKREGESLDAYLEQRVFAGADISTVSPDEAGMAGFSVFLKAYLSGLAAEKAAVESI